MAAAAPRAASIEESLMSSSSSSSSNAEVLLEVFKAIEERDDRRFAELCQPDFEICWPPSLPYGGTSRGRLPAGTTWTETWDRLQPGAAERKMDPAIVAAGDERLVVLWRQRGLSPAGERFDGEVLGLYDLRDGKLARAQMFYFDTATLAAFLARAGSAR
jgi:ketosteroid isomerase-like protein